MGGQYERQIFQHLEETLTKVDRLTQEIVTMKKEHAREVETLKTEIKGLRHENETLRTENSKLKEIMNKNSGNSGKPPSSDGFRKIENSREKTGRKPGGQPGRKGVAPKLYDNPTRIEDIKATKCSCGGEISYSGAYSAKQLVEIEFKTTIVEYREHKGICKKCQTGVENRGPLRDTITYGNNIKSFTALLSVEGMVSINRIKQMLSEMTSGQVNISEGSIAKWQKDLSRHVAPAIEVIKDKLQTARVLNKDETGIRTNKTLQWLHILGNDQYSLYAVNKKRGNDADKEMGILPGYSGVLVHDHLKGLYEFTCSHAECNAHILRYLKAVIESKKRKWAQEMIGLLLQAKKAVEPPGAPPLERAAIRGYHRRYDEILARGQQAFLQDESPDYNGDDMKLLRRLKQFKSEHLRFLSDPTVPFDNNQAERDLRMIKAKMKISGCFRADDGGAVFAALKSYTASLKKNHRNIFHGIRDAFLLSPVLL